MAMRLQLQLSGACGNLAGVGSAVPLGPAGARAGRGGGSLFQDQRELVRSGSAG